MKLSGTATLHAPVGTVWAALNDPAVLVRAIPGCERLAAAGPDSYHLTMTAGLASVRGTYTGQVSLSGQQPPNAFSLKATGAGAPGTVSTTVAVHLAADGDGATLLSYDADAVIGGVIAGVGQRMLASVAKRMAADFFTAVDAVLTSEEPALALPPPAVEPAWALGDQIAGTAPGGAAGVAFGGLAVDTRVSGATGEASGVPSQPAAPAAAGPAASGVSGGVWEAPRAVRQPAAPPGAPPKAFIFGALTGAAIALAGVAVGSLISRRRS